MLWLAGISCVLMAMPSHLSQYVKLSCFIPMIPVREYADEVGEKLSTVFDQIGSGGEGGGARTRELERENNYLRDQIVTLMDENIKLKSQLQGLGRLREAVPEKAYRTVFGRVLLSSEASWWRKSMTLSVGASAGIEVGMPVVWEHHLVGTISGVSEYTSRVSLVTDASFRTGAVPLPRYTAGAAMKYPDRDLGVVEGRSSGDCRLRWITRETPVEEGWFVVSCGDEISGVPPGLILGRVRSATPDRGPYYRIDVAPLIKFENLEHVMILVRNR